jgi:hypothetical protein
MIRSAAAFAVVALLGLSSGAPARAGAEAAWSQYTRAQLDQGKRALRKQRIKGKKLVKRQKSKAKQLVKRERRRMVAE